MAYKFIVTGQIIPHEIGDTVEFDKMPTDAMLHRLKLVTATPADESDPELDLTDRKQIAEKLKALGIEFDGRKSAAELAELLPKE